MTKAEHIAAVEARLRASFAGLVKRFPDAAPRYTTEYIRRLAEEAVEKYRSYEEPPHAASTLPGTGH